MMKGKAALYLQAIRMPATFRVVYASNGTRRYFAGSEEITEEEFHHRFPSRWAKDRSPPMVQPTTGYPKLSLSMSCAKSQIPHMTETLKKQGVPTDYTPDGSPVFTSRAHQKAFTKAVGGHNRDGGYGD